MVGQGKHTTIQMAKLITISAERVSPVVVETAKCGRINIENIQTAVAT